VTATILVVEDNPDNRKLFAWMLEDEGYAIEEAVTAEDGLEALRHRPFDLVLMDISLPGMDGKEATRRIRADLGLAHLPVIAVTAHAIKGEDAAIMASGVDALITKPIDETDLSRTIRTLLERRGSRG
jgi:two-component system cell cycle response regulator DivK